MNRRKKNMKKHQLSITWAFHINSPIFNKSVKPKVEKYMYCNCRFLSRLYSSNVYLPVVNCNRKSPSVLVCYCHSFGYAYVNTYGIHSVFKQFLWFCWSHTVFQFNLLQHIENHFSSWNQYPYPLKFIYNYISVYSAHFCCISSGWIRFN